METDGQTSVQMFGGNDAAPLKATFIFDCKPIAGCGIDTKFGYLEEASRLSRLLNSWIRFEFNRLKINVFGTLAYIDGGSAGWRRNESGEWARFGDHDEAWKTTPRATGQEGSYPAPVQKFVYTCNKCGFQKTVPIEKKNCSKCGAWDWSGVPEEVS